MNDQGSSNQNEHDPQAPKFMRPRRPVLDEPLEEEDSRKVPGEAETGYERTDDPESPAEDTQEVQTEQESDGQADPFEEEQQSDLKTVQSPYFPHGIYEDAQTVEAYYGRGDAGVKHEHLPEKEAMAEDVANGGQVHWLILIFAILMILVLLFLTLTRGIPAGFF